MFVRDAAHARYLGLTNVSLPHADRHYHGDWMIGKNEADAVKRRNQINQRNASKPLFPQNLGGNIWGGRKK